MMVHICKRFLKKIPCPVLSTFDCFCLVLFWVSSRTLRVFFDSSSKKRLFFRRTIEENWDIKTILRRKKIKNFQCKHRRSLQTKLKTNAPLREKNITKNARILYWKFFQYMTKIIKHWKSISTIKKNLDIKNH